MNFFFANHSKECFALFVALFIAFWLWGSKKGGWTELARAYRTKQKWHPIGKNPSYEHMVTIDKYQWEGTYIVPFEEGVLFCFPLLGFLYPKFLIPWNEFKNINQKHFPVLSIPYFEADVIAGGKNFRIRMPNYLIEKGNELGKWKF